MSGGSRHFEGDSAVFQALHKIAGRLKDLGVEYAVVEGMALFHHGLRRFTEDVDVLVTKDDLKKIHDHLDGLGYLPPHRRSKHLRDTELGVRIEFLTTGEYPGDGKEKPVAFPEPGPVGVESDGVWYLRLPTLVELRLASGMTNPGRFKDLSDVLELIKARELPADLAEELNPFVREKYRELWGQARRRYVALWRAPLAPTIEGTVEALREAAERLEEMRRDGVAWEIRGDDVPLSTTDPDIARACDMVDESEFWGDADN